MPGQLGDGGQAARVVEEVQVIEDQNRSLVHRREGCRYARHHGSLDRSAGRRQCVEHARVELRDAVERGRDVRQQDDRVVVVLVDCHPCERTPRARAPLRQQRRLPPTGTGGQRNHRGRVRLLQQRDERLARYGPAAKLRRTQLRLQQLERRRRPCESSGGGPRRRTDWRGRRGHDITGRRGPRRLADSRQRPSRGFRGGAARAGWRSEDDSRCSPRGSTASEFEPTIEEGRQAGKRADTSARGVSTRLEAGVILR